MCLIKCYLRVIDIDGVLYNIMLKKKIIYTTGLPRSGSTLLCQLLALHSDIYSIGHSSPLAGTLGQLRHNLSDNDFLLAQLDTDFDLVYQRLINAFRGFMEGWFIETDKPYVVDKNRGWLAQIETVRALDPDFKMLVCIREPGQIYGSIEAQHQKTLLLDFPDHLAHLSPYERANKLFANEGVIGGPLKSIEALQDIPSELQENLYYVVFEHLMEKPVEVIKDIHRWLGIEAQSFDRANLPVHIHESDSYYRFKYQHKTRSSISPPSYHQIPKRINQEINDNFNWFYNLFYPQKQE